MQNYIFYNSHKLKNEAQVTCAYNHNERRKEEYLSNPGIRRELTNRNYHFKKCDFPYGDLINKRMEQSGAKASKTSVILIDGVISPSPEWICNKTEDEQMEIFYRAYEFVVFRFSYENVLSAVVHLDEENPHMHFDVVPITADGRMCASDFYAYPNGGHVEQNMFYTHMHSYFPEISRGIPSTMTKREHVTMEYFKAAPDFFDMHEIMLDAINTIDTSIELVEERKQYAIGLYSAIAKVAAYTIVMQEGELNYYKKKLIPSYKKAIEKYENECCNIQENCIEHREFKACNEKAAVISNENMAVGQHQLTILRRTDILKE